MKDTLTTIENILNLKDTIEKENINLRIMDCFNFYYESHRYLYGDSQSLKLLKNRYDYILNCTKDLIKDKIKTDTQKDNSIYLV